ncbi:MAG: imidazolonepropionase [Treponema sp.]|nr:imidazolonepropionase [Treponema sp.]
MSAQIDLKLKNIGLLATPYGGRAKGGRDQGAISFVPDAEVGISGGRFFYAGPRGGCPGAAREIDCGGRLLTPGLVDAHTHLVFGGWRHGEMARRLSGDSYLDILKSGGGIIETVRRTREAGEEELFEKGLALLAEMLSQGTTTAECKSGYGLSLSAEMKQLRVMERLAREGPLDLALTFMGAHALPLEYAGDRAGYVSLVCDEMIPAVAEAGLARFCDVFCETGAFSLEESARVLRAGREHGLLCKAHVDEIDAMGGAEMAAEAGCVSAEHLVRASDEGIRALASSDAVACLLPTTSFCLDKDYARARDMIAAGLPVAICTDFNPGSSPCLNLQFPMYLACLKYRMTPAEALTAVTLNGAAALGLCAETGSVEAGKRADAVLWEARDLDYIFYRFGGSLARATIKNGEVVAGNI